jgi:four helix bundle protein
MASDAEKGTPQRGFEDLECYQLALSVLREAYRIAGRLPPDEKYNLVFQMRRSAVSAVLNIAEGYGRYHYLDMLRFYYIARGSLSETLSAFISCDHAGYTKGELNHQRDICHSALRSLNGYIRYVRARQQGRPEFGDRLLREDAPRYVACPNQREHRGLQAECPMCQDTDLPIYQGTDLPIYRDTDPPISQVDANKEHANEQ